MARVVKFALKMPDGSEIRDVISLKEHFYLPMIIFYFNNGKLLRWLRDRYEDDLANKLSEIVSEDVDIGYKICEVFEIKRDRDYIEKSWMDYHRIEKLMLCTDNYEYAAYIDNIAFNQDELIEKVENGCTNIYLCGDTFEIPKSDAKVTYIGINNPIVKVDHMVYDDVILSDVSCNFTDQVMTSSPKVDNNVCYDINIIKDLKPGDTFDFGIYENKPIKWLIIRRERYIHAITLENVTKREMHKEKGYVKWKKTDLYSWLNNDFLNKAFNEKERQKIVKQSDQYQSSSPYMNIIQSTFNWNPLLRSHNESNTYIPELISILNVSDLADAKNRNIITSSCCNKIGLENGEDIIWLSDNGTSTDPKYKTSSEMMFQTFSCSTGEINSKGMNRRSEIGVRPKIKIDVGLLNEGD